LKKLIIKPWLKINLLLIIDLFIFFNKKRVWWDGTTLGGGQWNILDILLFIKDLLKHLEAKIKIWENESNGNQRVGAKKSFA